MMMANQGDKKYKSSECSPKLTVTLKYFVVSTTCFERDNEPVRKLRTDPAPFACKIKMK
jgi:hypothetical protein